MATVIKTGVHWFVVEGETVLAGPFDRQADAWRWVDRRDWHALDDEETRRRIATAERW